MNKNVEPKQYMYRKLLHRCDQLRDKKNQITKTAQLADFFTYKDHARLWKHIN